MSLLSHEHHPTTFLIPCNDDTLNNVASNKFYYKDGKIYKDFESFTAPNSPSLLLPLPSNLWCAYVNVLYVKNIPRIHSECPIHK